MALAAAEHSSDALHPAPVVQLESFVAECPCRTVALIGVAVQVAVWDVAWAVVGSRRIAAAAAAAAALVLGASVPPVADESMEGDKTVEALASAKVVPMPHLSIPSLGLLVVQKSS